ncbi:SAM-dependent methyltransferase [Frankia sp. AvcI1]|uniref:SAM-dependent methyltransferase n=1 Tax=Frankia sp. AvcI1 TaxID=573496 RepID=UPI000A90D838|nr:SAM-dependent methyltransferase [Frankia sp. AvcI1]
MGVGQSPAQVAQFFGGLDLVGPGLRVVHRWQPAGDVDEGLTDAQVGVHGAVARKG